VKRKISYKSYIYIIIFFAAIFMFSCRAKKKLVNSTEVESFNNEIIADLIGRKDFNNLQYRFNGKVNFLEEAYNINGVIRIKEDSIIWVSVRLSVGIEAARLVILKDSIKISSRLADTYISEKIDYFERMTNVKISFELMEAILTNSLLGENINDYRPIEEEENGIFIERYNSDITEKYLVPGDPFYISEMYLSDGDNNIKVVYDEFEENIYGLFPGLMDIIMKNEKENIQGKLKISNIEFNKAELKFPFKGKR